AGTALAVAFYQASEESSRFQRQLVLTGNYAGKTTAQLQAMAKAMSGDGITQGRMADVLAQVVGSGAFTGRMVEVVSGAAARLQQVTGQAVDETISQFRRLQDEPVSAAKALDRTLHFLTAAQLEQIRVLGEQGRSTDAAKIAMTAYADAMNDRTADIRDNLGLLERSWKTLSGAASRAWDAMLDIGREETIEDKISALRKKIENGGTLAGKAFIPVTQQDRDELGRLEDEKYRRDMTAAKAQAERNFQEQQKRRNEQNAALNRKNESEEERHRREVAAIKGMQYADEKVRNEALERENSRHKKAVTRENKKPGGRDDEATRLLGRYSQHRAQMEGELALARVDSTGKLTESEKQLLALRQRLTDMQKKTLTTADKSVLAKRHELEQMLQASVVTEKTLVHQRALNDLKKKTVQLTAQLTKEEEHARQRQTAALATSGMGGQSGSRVGEMLKLQQSYEEKLAQLSRDSAAKGVNNTAEYAQAEQALKHSLLRRLADLQSYYGQMDAARSDWRNGATRALDDFVVQGRDVAGMTERVFRNAFNGMTDAVANFALTGKMSFRSFASSVLSDLSRMAARMATSQALSSVMGAFGVGAAGAGANAIASFGANFSFNADGGVYRSPDLSRYSGSVVSRPTFFAFAKGAGVMGEAGPEAILPLKRGANGRLGVVAGLAGGAGRVFAPQYHVEIINDGTNGKIGPEALQSLYDVSRKAASDYFEQQLRDGGSLR
ncbi:phage tail tape measure protein, partial [Salmonella enterica]|nr:phage tail tape measure protein [Salmonella enterica]